MRDAIFYVGFQPHGIFWKSSTVDTSSLRGLWRAGSFLGRGTGWVNHGLCTVRSAITNKKELVGNVIIRGNHYFSAH